MMIQAHPDRRHALEEQVRQTVRKYRMFRPGERVLVAVSGGADSMAMLFSLLKLASEFEITLSVAHLNHRIRGKDADDDEAFVRALSERLHLDFFSESVDLKERAAKEGRNLEELARNVRYEFLRRSASQWGAHKIAVGHTMNDQAETILFRFIRGSGIQGLSAIHPIMGDAIVRPLIDCQRGDVLQYLKDLGVEFREDSTNRDLTYARNRIRLELMPYLEEHLNPRLVRTLAREASLARETWSLIESLAKIKLEELGRKVDEGMCIELEAFSSLHTALQKQVLRQALKECLGSLHGITARHIDGILSLCAGARSGGRLRIPGGCVAVRQFDSLLLAIAPGEPRAYAYRLDIPGEVSVPEAKVVFRCTICRKSDGSRAATAAPVHAYLNKRQLPGCLTVRSKRPGDRYGGPGHRKVKKMLIDAKVPVSERGRLPMVAAGEYVIWIPGFRPARTFSEQSDTEESVLVEMVPQVHQG